MTASAGVNSAGGGTSTIGLKPPPPDSVPESGIAASLNAAPVGDSESGRVWVVVVAPNEDGLQKPITFDVPKPVVAGRVPPSGVTIELVDADGTAVVTDGEPISGDVVAGDSTGTGDVVTGNVANGDVSGGEAGDGDTAVADGASDEIAGQVEPAPVVPLTGHMVMLPNAGPCDWPRVPV